MNVQCEKCGTGYGLDETLVGPSGTTVRCTVCGHVFKVYAAGGARVESWVLRQASGATFPFDRLGTLQDWIAEGKVSEQDMIAKTGGEWRRLSDLVEMKPFFDAARGRQVRREVTQPVAAGFARPSASDYAATIRQAPLGQAPAPAPQQPVQHVTAAYESAAAPRAPMARPAVAPVAQATPTVRAAPAHSPSFAATAPTLPAMPSPVRASAHEAADTIQAFLPASQLPQAPAPFAVQQVSEDAPTLMQVPAAHAPTLPAASHPPPEQTPRPAPVRPRVATFQPWQEGPEAPPQAGYRGGAPAYAAEPDLSQVPAAGEEERWVRGRPVAAAGPAWAEQAQPAASHREFEEDEDALPPRRRIGRWIALAVVALLLGGGFYVYTFQREALDGLLGGLAGGGEADRHQAFFLKGQESFLLDTDVAFRQADREFQKVLALVEGDASTLGSLALMYAVWSQYLRDAEIDARTDAGSQATEGEEPDLREAERLAREAKEKLDEARRWADQAREAGAELPVVRVALADVARLRGKLEEAEKHLGTTPGGPADPAAEYVRALLAIDRGRGPEEVERLLSGMPKGEELLRVLYRRARVLASAGRTEEARKVIERLVSLNRDHERGRSLAARLEAGLAVALRSGEAPAAAEAPAADVAGGAGKTGADEPAPEEKVAVAPTAGGVGAPHEGAGGGSPEAMLARAVRLQESGQAAQAIQLFETVLQKDPGNIDAMSGLGYCNLDRGNKGQAVTWFRRALGGGGGSFGPAIIGLAETYKSQGQKAEALKWYRRYLEVHPGGRDASLARSNIQRLEQEVGAEGRPAAADGAGDQPASDQPSDDSPYDKPVEKPADKPAGDSPYEKPADKPAADPPAEKPADKPAAASPDPYSAEG